MGRSLLAVMAAMLVAFLVELAGQTVVARAVGSGQTAEALEMTTANIVGALAVHALAAGTGGFFAARFAPEHHRLHAISFGAAMGALAAVVALLGGAGIVWTLVFAAVPPMAAYAAGRVAWNPPAEDQNQPAKE